MDTKRVETGCLETDGFNLQYRIEGKGMPAIVIGSAIYYPRTFSENLRQHLRLVFADHRGFVPTSRPLDVSEYTLDVILDDIERLRQTLNLGRILIIGHSGHGFMALEYAKKYPDSVAGIVMISLGPDCSLASRAAAEQYFQDSVCPERKAFLEENLSLLPAEIEAEPHRQFIQFCIRLGALSWYDFRFDATPLWKDVEVNMPIIDYLWGVVFRDIDIAKGLDTLNKPVFLGLGLYDFLVAPFFSWNSVRSKFQNLTLRLFERSSHTPQYEEPALFDKALLAWISESVQN